MTLANEPTMGEVMRRLDEVARQLAGLAEQMQRDRVAATAQALEDRKHAEETFLRHDVYVANRSTDQANRAADQGMVANLFQDIKGIEKDRETDVAWRRQIILAVTLLTITTLVTVAIAVSNLLAR